MDRNTPLNYQDPPYARRVPLAKKHVQVAVSATDHNALVDEYNELLEDIDMLLRSFDLLTQEKVQKTKEEIRSKNPLTAQKPQTAKNP